MLKKWLLVGSLLAGLLIASCPDFSLFDFGVHFVPRGLTFDYCRCSIFEFPGPKSGPVLGTDSGPEMGTLFGPLNVFCIQGPETVPISGSESVPKTGPFFGPGIKKLRAPAMPFLHRANQPWSRQLATPQCFSHMERSGGPSRSAARREGQEVSSGLSAF